MDYNNIAVQQVQALLQEVLQASDTEAALRQYAPAIDENFLALLAANIKAAEEKNLKTLVIAHSAARASTKCAS